MTRLRMAVIGTGALGRHHARILSQMPDIELVAVADVNAAAAAAIAASCQSDHCRARSLTDYRELLPEIQAVVVAVPTFAHRTVAAEFLTAGIDVLVEKPIAAAVDDASCLVDLASRHDALLSVGHVERFNPALRAALPGLDNPRYVRMERLAPFSFRSTDIGVVHDLMIHDIDLVLDMIGAPVADVQACGMQILTEHEDCAQARLVFSNGAVADLSVNRVSPVVSRNVQIWNATSCLQIDLGARTAVRYAPGTRLKFGKSPLDRAREPGANIEQLKQEIFGQYIEVDTLTVEPCDQLTEELRAFIETSLTGLRKAPLASGDAALDAMRVAQRVLDQVAATRVELPASRQRRAG